MAGSARRLDRPIGLAGLATGWAGLVGWPAAQSAERTGTAYSIGSKGRQVTLGRGSGMLAHLRLEI
ncbi:hypothetical protein E2562_025710 [Oryza meyeriana var. granulata]|uniref:Uncharacterized protein n=1 Tax=Oryza meyeriana var. granulata TaxID=110450 RepID=A0A6G1CSR8_9ORYZ|nr:hypothetical protein E2562_025710 [Oryza meyeriana var. granulata]